MWNKKIFTIILLLLIFSCFILYGVKRIKVSTKIINYCNKNYQEDLEINLPLFTNFDWDKVVIYTIGTTSEDFYELTGINYSGEFDLSQGMIFINNNKIVYEEYFKTDYETPDKFKISPYSDINYNNNINVFYKENALFNVTKLEYNGENRYLLKPIGLDKYKEKISN